MPIVGFNFEKVHVEKKNLIKGKVQIKSNVSILNVEEEQLPTGKIKADGLRFNFSYTVNYEPNIGNISLTGFIYFLDDPKIIKEIAKQWKKDKKISPEITAQIVNTVLLKSTVKALNLSQEVNLPPHLPLPQITQKIDPKNYIG